MGSNDKRNCTNMDSDKIRYVASCLLAYCLLSWGTFFFGFALEQKKHTKFCIFQLTYEDKFGILIQTFCCVKNYLIN